jgi:hypothetical protein
VIIYKESRGDSLSYNGQDYGLMQVNNFHIKHGTAIKDSLFYMDYNVKYGYEIYLEFSKMDYENRFAGYNGSQSYQQDAIKILESL